MRWIAGVTALAVLASASGCGADEPVRFDSEGNAELTCMTHQQDPPGPDYTDPTRTDLGRNLTVFRYYTRNADKGYCDGSGPTSADRAWAEFTAQQTANRATVAPILDAPTG